MLASRLLRGTFGAVAVIVTALVAAVPASAAVIVDFSGTFVNYPNPPSYHALLNGGSFSGTFTLPDELPLGDNESMSFTAFTVNVYDSSDALIYTFGDGAAGYSGKVSSAYVSYYGGDIVDFYGPGSSYFQLVFSSPFTGNGSPNSTGPGSYSYTYLPSGDYGYVASAVAAIRSTPVPEASPVLALAAGLSILLALGFAGRRSLADR